MLCCLVRAVCIGVFAGIVLSGCAVEASKRSATETAAAAPVRNAAGRGPTIKIAANGPADTVRAFYGDLREGRIREAIYLTNLRPAIEGLTDDELKEFQVDFEAIGKLVPPELEINGEIIAGDTATVTAKLPGEDPEKPEFQKVNLRKNGDVWMILTVDEAAEKRIRQEGKNYFFNLRIETHEDEARSMLDRIAKAQLAYSAQNQGSYGDMAALVDAGYLPADVRSADSTGYNYSVRISADKRSYSAAATPAVYGKTGKLSFSVDLDKKGMARLTSRDAGAVKGK